jgi:hypothetical protein
MKADPKLISPCGLYCGVCAIRMAHIDKNEKLKEKLVNLYKGGTPGKGTLPNSGQLTTGDIRCEGCNSDDLFMHCKQCFIRIVQRTRRLKDAINVRISLAHTYRTFQWRLGKK